MPPSGDTTLSTVENALEIVNSIWELDGATLTEIANHAGLPVSTTHNYLKTLEQNEYVSKKDSKYSLSLRFYELGQHTKREVGLSDVAKPIMSQLADETGERVWLIVEDHGYAVALDVATGDRAVPVQVDIGTRIPIHTIASGKIILAHYSDGRVATLVDERGLAPRTENTVTGTDELFAELERWREAGYAVNYGESIRNLHSVAVPLRSNDSVLGALSIAGPEQRLTEEAITGELVPLLLEASNEIELKIEYS